METKILEFLDQKSGPMATAYIAKYCIFSESLLAGEHPSKSLVQSAYYHLKKLANQGKIRYVPRGCWIKNKEE